ncbi:MAG: phage tail assembly protein [Clostridiales bacterium]|nr:phage tail assembly protein [Clostridiales bacterium]
MATKEENLSKSLTKVEEMEKQTDTRKKLKEQLGNVTYDLSDPFTYCGVTYTTLQLNFAALTGRDIEAIDDELTDMGINVVSPAANRKYLRIFAARAAGIPADAIEAMPVADYNAITTKAQRFLLLST